LFCTARNSKQLADVLALGLGLAFYPIAALFNGASTSCPAGWWRVASLLACTNGGRATSEFFSRLAPLRLLLLCGVIPNRSGAYWAPVARRRELTKAQTF
jgi:hypothetical protein